MRRTRNTQGTRSAGALAAALAVGTAALVVPTGSAAEPVPQGTIGGPLHAEMYPSGLETAPDGTVVVADTGNNRVAKYDAAGALVWSVGSHGAGTRQFDNPRDVGVDAAGNVYVADTRNSRIVKLAADGTWLGETSGPATAFSFPLGVSAKGDTVYVGDTGRHRVVVLDDDLTVLREVVANGVCSNINDNRDAQADSAGNIYVAGYKTNEILKFSPSGTCLGKWGGTGEATGRFRTPYGVATATDPVTGQELVHVADGLNNRVQVFTTTGAFVAAFGSYGEPEQPGTFTTMRRVAVDAAGNVWAADLWGNRIQRWDRTATGFSYRRTVGAVLPQPTSTAVFHEARGMDFAPDGDLWVTDTVHHQLARFDAAGRLVDTCGQRAAEGTQLGQFNWPRGAAVDPATGNLWVADTKQHQLQVLTEDCEGIGFVRNVNAGADSRSLNWPYDIAIRDSDRFAFVVDTQNHRIKAYDVANAVFPADNKGPLPAYVFGTRGGGATNFRWPSGVAVGPTGNVFVADRGNNRVQELSFTAAAGFAPVRTWNAGGTLDQPEGVAVDATGRVFVADSADDELVVLAPDRTVEATVGGLTHPAAVEVAGDGSVRLADTYADVVRTYSMSTLPPDTTAPTGVFTTPAAGASVPAGAVTLTGSATDDRGLGAVQVALRRQDTGTWLRADGSWGAFQWLPAALASPGATTSGWSFTRTLPVVTGYTAQLRVDDAAGNQNATPRPTRSFTTTSDGPPDAAPPTGTVTAPAAGATVPAPVTIAGTAADDKSVASVRIGLKQSATGLWWNGTGWQATTAKVDAVLAQPGASSTTWTLTVAGLPAGGYGFSTDVLDATGKSATGTGKPAWRSFTVGG